MQHEGIHYYIAENVWVGGIIGGIVGMRIKFNLGTLSYDQFTVVVVPNLGGHVIGMVADSVSDEMTWFLSKSGLHW